MLLCSVLSVLAIVIGCQKILTYHALPPIKNDKYILCRFLSKLK